MSTARELVFIKAVLFATAAHDQQRRKYTGEPYIMHPLEVADILVRYGADDGEMVVAAVLHDVLEDTEATAEQVEGLFGARVRKLVEEVTDVSKLEDGNRAIRKALDREHIARASPEAKTVKLADLISNTRSIAKHDKDFAKVYLPEKRLLLNVMHDASHPQLWELARHTLATAERQIRA